MFEYKLDFYQNLLTLTILILGLFLVLVIGAKKKGDVAKILILYVWHTLFAAIYYLFSLSNVSDAKGYYRSSITEDSFQFYPGSPFVNYIASIFSRGIDASYLNTALVFSIIGALGLVLFYLSLKKYLNSLSSYWFLILLLPSMSFWTSSLSKDSISFFAVCLLIYAITTSKKTILLSSIAFFAMFMVRPHIGALILASYVIYFIIRAKVHILFKVITIPAILAGLLLSISFVEQYIGLDESSADGYMDYIDKRESVSQTGGSAVDISSMSYPMKMFTYTFRPLPFEAHSITALVNSIENTLLLFAFIYIVIKTRFKLRPFIQDKNMWLFAYLMLTSSVLALTTANLGIATRQKWMFMPVIIYLLIYVFHQYRTDSLKN
ncbi:hypothetical protein MN210_17635 [Psychrobacter raelei]|uniref:Glycosyltransferase RgtA/B/C/D-like domain-containing protein n=1 Tax=Psychrobacter raelei TaxID=2565531 RepID=A0AAU6PW73_9GAMM